MGKECSRKGDGAGVEAPSDGQYVYSPFKISVQK